MTHAFAVRSTRRDRPTGRRPQGDTIGIIEAPGAKGAHLSSDATSRVDGRGYAVASSLTPYRLNEVMLDPKGISANVELENARLLTAPRAGAVVPLKYTTATGQSYLIRVQAAAGESIPFGAEVVNGMDQVVGYVGQASQAFVRVSDENSGALSIRWGNQGRCALDWRPSSSTAVANQTVQVDSACRSAALTP